MASQLERIFIDIRSKSVVAQYPREVEGCSADAASTNLDMKRCDKRLRTI
jgi:hypothetical protein